MRACMRVLRVLRVLRPIRAIRATAFMAAKEPVVICRQKREVAVVLSIAEYERLARFNVAEFQRFCDTVGARAAQSGLTEDQLARLLADD